MKLLFSILILAQFVPPTPIGIKGDGRERKPAGPVAFPREETWVRATTPHFSIISGAGERRTIEIARELESLQSALASLQGAQPPAATRVIVFGRRGDAEEYFRLLLPTATPSGLFVTQRSGGAMMVDASRGTDRTVYHELIHYLLSTRDPRPPLWLEEGLAEYYSTVRLGGGTVTVGDSIPGHLAALRRYGAMPLEKLFAVEYETQAASQNVFYATSWAAVEWLMRTNRAAFPSFLAHVASGGGIDNALRADYNIGVADLQKAVTHYATARGGNSYRIDVAEPPAPAIEPLRRADLLYELGLFLSAAEQFATEAERHLRAAIALDPKHGRAYAALADMRVRSKAFDEAEPLFAAAVAATPDDGDVLLAYAEGLLRNEIGAFAETADLERSEGQLARFRKARSLAERALDHGADRARSLGAIGTSYLVEDDLRPGIDALEKAHALAPSRADYALHLYAMLLRAGDESRAAAIESSLLASHEAQTVFATRAVKTRVTLDRANALVHEQKLAEAAAVLRRFISSADPIARADLERQASELEKTATVNDEIRAYNEAVTLAKEGRRKDALERLDALLAHATDSSVVADATKFREQLRRAKH